MPRAAACAALLVALSLPLAAEPLAVRCGKLLDPATKSVKTNAVVAIDGRTVVASRARGREDARPHRLHLPPGPHRRPHAPPPAGGRDVGGVRRAGAEGVDPLSRAPRRGRGEDRARPRLHDAPRSRDRGGRFHRRRPEEGVRPRDRPGAARRDGGPRHGADGALPAPRILVGAEDAGRRPEVRRGGRLPEGGPDPGAVRRRLDQGLRGRLVLPDAGGRLGLDPELHAGGDERHRRRGASPSEEGGRPLDDADRPPDRPRGRRRLDRARRRDRRRDGEDNGGEEDPVLPDDHRGRLREGAARKDEPGLGPALGRVSGVVPAAR